MCVLDTCHIHRLPLAQQSLILIEMGLPGKLVCAQLEHCSHLNTAQQTSGLKVVVTFEQLDFCNRVFAF